MSLTNILNKLGIDPKNVIEDETLRNEVNEAAEEGVGTKLPESPAGFPNNPFLSEAQTSKGGLFANLGGGDVVALEEGMKMSEFPTGEGAPFDIDGQFMQPVYVNTTAESISIDVVSDGFGPSDQDLNVGPYNEAKFAGRNQWTRIPNGLGTPYPLNPPETAWNEDGNFEGKPIAGGPDGDYELVEISETENGFKVVWEYLGDGGQSNTASASIASSSVTTDSEDGEDVPSQDPEDDADAPI